MKHLWARDMTDAAIAAEIDKLGKKWDKFRAGDCDGSGSPGEWMIERLDELEHEQKQRAEPSVQRDPAKEP